MRVIGSFKLGQQCQTMQVIFAFNLKFCFTQKVTAQYTFNNVLENT